MNIEKKKKVRSLKKTSPLKTKKHVNKIEGLENTLLFSKYNYTPNNSDQKRKRSLGNAVIVYDPKGLIEIIQTLILKNKNNKIVSDILKKDYEFVVKKYT